MDRREAIRRAGNVGAYCDPNMVHGFNPDMFERALEQAGYVIVPAEPTEAMLKAADKSLWDQMKSSEPSARNDRPICRAIYRAMISAGKEGA